MGDAERKRAVREWFRVDLGGDRERFLRRTKLSKGRATQILTGEEAFGEKAATNLARRAGLPDEYFNERAARPPRDAPPIEKYAELLKLWDPLFQDQKDALMLTIRAEHTRTLTAIKEMRARGLLNKDIPENVLPDEFTRPAQRDLAIGAAADQPKRRRRE